MSNSSSEYLCAYPATCTECGTIDKPIGRTEPTSGDFMQRCRSCGHEWVAMTSAERVAEAEARMEEAKEVLNPVLRSFLRGKMLR